MPTDAKIGPQLCLETFEVFEFVILSLFLDGKNGDGAQVGLTIVKATIVDIFFQFFVKIGKMVSGSCRSYHSKRYKCEEKGYKKDTCVSLPSSYFWTHF